jgi:cell division protein ZapA
MPEVKITIGGRDFTVSCQEGEEHFLQSAATMLDGEASALSAQIGRLPEARMLLMSGLMLADKTIGMEEQLRAAQDRLAGLEGEIQSLRNAPAPEPERVEVAVIPEIVTESFAEIAARAEALAATVEEKTAALA